MDCFFSWSNKLPAEFFGNLLSGCKVRFWRPTLAQVIENLVGDGVTDSGESANVSEIDFAFSQGGIPLAVRVCVTHNGDKLKRGRVEGKNYFQTIFSKSINLN
jgi:hypothetical protein